MVYWYASIEGGSTQRISTHVFIMQTPPLAEAVKRCRFFPLTFLLHMDPYRLPGPPPPSSYIPPPGLLSFASLANILFN